MPFRVNFADYAKGVPVHGPVDAGYGLRALAEQNLKQQQMAEQTRQNQNQGQDQSQTNQKSTDRKEKEVNLDLIYSKNDNDINLTNSLFSLVTRPIFNLSTRYCMSLATLDGSLLNSLPLLTNLFKLSL